MHNIYGHIDKPKFNKPNPPHKKEKENEALFNVLGHTDFIGSL
jgi:hypothetical protein